MNFSCLLAFLMVPERRALRLLHSADPKTPSLSTVENCSIVLCSHTASSLPLPPANRKGLFLRMTAKQKHTKGVRITSTDKAL